MADVKSHATHYDMRSDGELSLIDEGLPPNAEYLNTSVHEYLPLNIEITQEHLHVRGHQDKG